VKRLLLAVPVAALALVMTSCSHPAHAGAAATVGSVRVPTSTLQGMVDRGVKVIPASVTTKPSAIDIERSDLTRLIQLEVLKTMAADMHLTVTDQDTTTALTAAAEQNAQSSDAASATKALQDSAAQSGIDTTTLRTYGEVIAYETKIIEALPTSNADLQAAYQKNIASFEQVHVAHILVATPALANSILAQVKADPTKFAALAKQYSTDTGSKDNGGDLGFASPSSYVAPFGTDAEAGKDGTIIGPVKTQYGYHIIKIIAHKTTSLADATQQLKLSLNGTEFTTKYGQALKNIKISVNPRYGVWSVSGSQDGLGLVVASTTGDLSSPAGSSASSSPAASPAATTPAATSSATAGG
jgi:foldase protein PrsA